MNHKAPKAERKPRNMEYANRVRRIRALEEQAGKQAATTPQPLLLDYPAWRMSFSAYAEHKDWHVPDILSGSQEIRQSRDASEGGESPTRCGFKNRHKESTPAQTLPESLDAWLAQPTQDIGGNFMPDRIQSNYDRYGEECVICGEDSWTCEHFEEANCDE